MRKQPAHNSVQKSALNIIQIQNKYGYRNYMGCYLLQHCSNQIHAAYAFSQTKPTFYLPTFTIISILLSYIPAFFLLGPA